ncbi:PepSY domain-containing protein [Desemzia sp. RIT804]|uniref:PepSY domain-containing protein n=1 Tax=Desemzia sp. RIT 804 TaxID=2810209 RepID=UPI00194E2F24|nr:PepSY domain-containing protein [Desemzia sp. RIT 804]MBM6613955.1 PepSY domain-containing protein [Desemzia sp. RIT 804]
MTNKRKLALLTLVSTGILGACGTNSSNDADLEEQSSSAQESSMDSHSEDMSSESSESGTTDESSSSSSGSTQGINEQEFDISLDDAIQIYNETHPNSSIESIEFDDDDAKYEYDFDGFDDANEYELSIDASTGEAVDRETDSDNDDNNEALNLDNIVSPQEAMTTALEEVGSGYVDSWHLDTENGLTVYEISIENSQDDDDDIIINAQTGEFINKD